MNACQARDDAADVYQLDAGKCSFAVVSTLPMASSWFAFFELYLLKSAISMKSLVYHSERHDLLNFYSNA